MKIDGNENRDILTGNEDVLLLGSYREGEREWEKIPNFTKNAG